jgi:predicted metal-dependent hydrolase
MTTESKNDLGRADRAIPVRAPSFRFGADIPRLWFGGNTFLTFFFDGLNLTFPEGERLFVRAVHEHRAQIKDPVLLAQMRGFAGQEGRHAQAHEQLFESLRAQGFDLDPFFRAYDRYTRYVNRRVPAASRLASTAALEHYTATLALLMFDHDLLRDAHPEMRKLLLWHATEELEHRAVAFDVLRAVRPSYALRARAFVMSSLSLLFWTLFGMSLFVRQSRTPLRILWHDLRAARRLTGGTLGWPLIRALLVYLKPGFHPNQVGSLDAPLAWLRKEGIDVPVGVPAVTSATA